MRKSSLVVLSLVVLLTSLVVLPVSAAKATYKAGGKVTAYADAWSSEIVSGHWSVTVEDGVVDFKVFYVERNLDWTVEDSPDGSIDLFWHTLTWASTPSINDDALTFSCTMTITKLKTMMDGSKEWVIWDTAELYVTIDEDGMWLDRPPFPSSPGQDFDVLGVTNHLKY